MIIGSTPFLDSTAEDIAQSFTVPGPVTAAIVQGTMYTYTSFPIPDYKQIQVVIAERGLAAAGGAGSYLMKQLSNGPEVNNKQITHTIHDCYAFMSFSTFLFLFSYHGYKLENPCKRCENVFDYNLGLI